MRNSSAKHLRIGAPHKPYLEVIFHRWQSVSKYGYHTANNGPETNPPYDAHCIVRTQSMVCGTATGTETTTVDDKEAAALSFFFSLLLL